MNRFNVDRNKKWVSWWPFEGRRREKKKTRNGLGRSPAKVVWGKESRKRTRREANECGRDQWNVKIQIALRPDQVWWCRWLERMIRRACGSLPFTFQTRKKKKPQVSTSQLLSKKNESVSRFFFRDTVHPSSGRLVSIRHRFSYFHFHLLRSNSSTLTQNANIPDGYCATPVGAYGGKNRVKYGEWRSLSIDRWKYSKW